MRYLQFAKRKLGRDDLAVASYHMGVGNLQPALKDYGKGTVPYVRLYFDSSPLRHPPAWSFLASLGDDSATYLWRVRAADQILHMAAANPALQPGARSLHERAQLGRGRRCTRPTETIFRPLRRRPRCARRRRARDRAPAPRYLRLHGLRLDPAHGRAGRQGRRAARACTAAAPAGARDAPGYSAPGADDLGHPAPCRHQHGARHPTTRRLLRLDDRGDHRLLAAHHGLRLRHRPDYPSRAQAMAFSSSSTG